MRRSNRFILAIILSLATLPAWAGGVNMGGFNCRQTLPCNASDPVFPTNDQLMSMVNACIGYEDGLPASNNFVVAEAGLDANGCFQTNPSAFPGIDGLRSLPQCCIKQMPSGACAVRCDLISH